MTDTEHILVESGLSPEATTRRLGELLHAEVKRLKTGELVVSRLTAGDPGRRVVGEVSENGYGEDEPAPGDESVYDRYPLVLEVWVSGRSDEELLHAEASRIFDEIVQKLPWPAVHVRVEGVVFAATNPVSGRKDFPTGTSYAADGRALWAPYAHP